MLNNQKIVVVMPAYNAARTLRYVYEEVPKDVVDEIILVDDASNDSTVDIAHELSITCFVHQSNIGYGANQKTCYARALELGADVVVMVHPDYQYTPKLITAMAGMVTSGVYDAVLGSRVLGSGAVPQGMPFYKFVANRVLTAIQNICLSRKLSEYHTGFRAFSRKVLVNLPLGENSNDFVFDNEMITQLIFFDYKIGEISCPAKYFEDASSIGLVSSIRYGFGVLRTTALFLISKSGIWQAKIFKTDGQRLNVRR